MRRVKKRNDSNNKNNNDNGNDNKDRNDIRINNDNDIGSLLCKAHSNNNNDCIKNDNNNILNNDSKKLVRSRKTMIT